MQIKRLRIDPNKLNMITESPEAIRARIAAARQDVSELTGPGRLTEHDHRENQILVKARQKAVSLDLDMNDLMAGLGTARLPIVELFPEDRQGMSGDREFLTEEFPTAQDNYIMEDLYQPPAHKSARVDLTRRIAAAPAQSSPRQALREQIIGNRRSAPPAAAPTGPPWRVKAFLGETRGGNEIPVWKVSNAKTGSQIDKLFRIEGVAVRIAGMLNESGDQNDPRVVSLINVYDKRDKLLKEARLLEKSASGKPMKTARLGAIEAEINQLDRRLGN